MLVLSRKAGESIVLSNSIRVMVVEIAAGVVRLGIEAPREVSIVRAELHGAVEGENLRSVTKDQLAPQPQLLGRLRGKSGVKTAGESPRGEKGGNGGDGRKGR